ncbi:MAG TPA: metallophosphoesterase [Vicinamibacteria bacterium]
MTPNRFWLALLLFHTVVLAASWYVARKWADPARSALPNGRWLLALARDLGPLAVFAYLASLLATLLANVDQVARLRVGAISGRLMGQALFGEAILLGLALAWAHHRAGRSSRAALFGATAFGLLAVYVDAFHVEPRMLRVRQHVVDRAGGAAEARPLRILHITDIQTPVIGPREERALRLGLEARPDLIVLTGDYVQDALGRPTEDQAASDLRALMARIGFDAPLGVFATDGDAGPQCREVFAGTHVRCLVDESARVELPEGGTLAITGLSRTRGRERDPAWLSWLMRQGPQGDHHIVISHAPDFVDALPEPVALVLAGHTHGGQVVLPFFGPPRTAIRLPRRYAADLHDYRGTPLHVSRGLGMERGFTIPVRFLCPPEICLLDVRLPQGARSSNTTSPPNRATSASAPAAAGSSRSMRAHLLGP